MGDLEITDLLRRWRDGDDSALDTLMPMVQDELKRIARRHLRSERTDHTLQSTALINEAYLRLVGAEIDWRDRAHFYAVAARMMRRILVDYARGEKRAKRGGGRTRLSIDELTEPATRAEIALLDLEDALLRLAEFDERKSLALELTYFGGLTYEETAAALRVSEATVHRELRLARAWLHRELSAPS